MDAGSQRELARLLATLRKEGRQQSGMEPRLIPPDKETAYRVARMVEEELGWEVAGWKIAGAKADMQKALRTDSPIPVSAVPFRKPNMRRCSVPIFRRERLSTASQK